MSAPYVTPFADVTGFARGTPEAAAAAAAGLDALSAGGFMAPNYVYTSHGEQLVTNTLTSGPVLASCNVRPGPCADAVTRGLLSGLQPMLTGDESLFPADRMYYHAAAKRGPAHTSSMTLPKPAGLVDTSSTTVRPAGPMSTSSTTLPKPAGHLPTSSTTLPKPAGPMSTSSTTLPKPAGHLSTSSTTLPKPAGHLPTSSTTVRPAGPMSTSSTTVRPAGPMSTSSTTVRPAMRK